MTKYHTVRNCSYGKFDENAYTYMKRKAHVRICTYM